MKKAISTKLHYYATMSLSIVLLVIMSSTSYAIVQGQSHTSVSNSDILQSDRDYYGFIESRPSGTAGTWVVSGRSFTATDSTRLDPDDGPLTVGRCVSVDYEGDLAREIESESASDCDNAPSPPTPPGPGDDDDYYGFIKSRPSGTAGTWVVSGRSFTATDSTRLDPDDGPLTVGRCVSVDYEGDQAREIESEPASDCNNAPSPPDPGAINIYLPLII
ncbi:MAG: hypothetical protein GFH27_549431n33 [Chloroflexi bacterium AL-W]|nr:hypothetical protein [Chloroflexi bacterium AL-N1]NOK71637.1 hypothetical protein [Chloroflexi bacterium AL-N10]NOK78937.1 hypothetical protein [Chloroflexi bacterium AL-N5]NOK86412.1 hypothetical protein [Chloroflexi bacterium AL-W]